MRSAGVEPSGYRFAASGRLVRTKPPRYATIKGRALTEISTPELRKYPCPCGSYVWAAIGEELERRRPRGASLYYGPEKGWEPLYA